MSRMDEQAIAVLNLAAARLMGHAGTLPEHVDERRTEIEGDWRKWLLTLFPDSFTTFAPHHSEFWDWIWDIEPGTKPQPFVAIWPRGGGKSTNAEAACVAVGARQKRSYILYISATQAQADDHVQNVAAWLESRPITTYYPEMANRRVGKYGTSRGWRRNRLRTASGVTVDAVGMDTASRGLKLEDERPDFIIVDDIDEEDDTRETTLKKIRRLTHAILPAGAPDAAEVFIQNLILPEGIFARLAGIASEPADFLATRQVSGPHPALRGMQTETRDGVITIVDGEPTWDYMDVGACQDMMNAIGYQAFQSECQHQVEETGTIVFQRAWWAQGRARYDMDKPYLDRLEHVGYWMHIDTAFSDKDSADYTAIAVFALTHDRRLRLYHMYRQRLDFPDLVTEVEATVRMFNQNGKLQEVTIEDKGSGTSLLQTLRATGDPLLRRKLVAWQPRGSKEERARLSSPWCRMALVELPHPGPEVPWLTEFEAELYRFPHSLYADQVDTFVQGILYLEPWLEAGHQRRLRGSE